MLKKFVKDRAHNRYEAYCCEDIDKRLGALEEAVKALVAQTVPDEAVTLAKLANDARTYTREINKGMHISEWIGTRAEYNAYLASHYPPDPNIRFTITDDPAPAQVITEYYPDGQFELPVGSLVIAQNSALIMYGILRTVEPWVVFEQTNECMPCAYLDRTRAETVATNMKGTMCKLAGTWRVCGLIDTEYALLQRVK